jgi:hypothetical protein
VFDYYAILYTPSHSQETAMTLEDRTARLTILIDPRKKTFFESLCAQEDATSSQIVRRLIRRYIEERTGQPWTVPQDAPKGVPQAHRKARQKVVRRPR